MSEKKLYMVTAISTFKIRYVVEMSEKEVKKFAKNAPINDPFEDDLKEFSQEDLGEKILEYFPITQKEYLKIFNKDNAYLSRWDDKQKLSFINKVRE